MASRSSCWWLHVWCLVILQHTWISSNQPAPTNETHWDNFTTGSGHVYVNVEATTETFSVTNNETSRTPNTTLETSWNNFTTRPDQIFITSKETPDTSLEIFPSNVTVVLHLTDISEDSSGKPNSTLESLLNNTPTGADLSNITQKTTRSPNITLQSHPENVTSGPHLTHITEETSGILNSTLEKFPNNATTRADVSYITEEAPRAPNSTLENYPSNVTSAPHQTYITEETYKAPNSSPENYSSNVMSGAHSTFTTQDTSGTSTSTLEPYPNNVTTRSDMSYLTEETSRTTRTTTEKYPYYPSNVTSGSHLTYITEETSRTPNTTLMSYPSNVTSEPRSTFTTQDISGTSTSTLEPYPNNATTRPDMSYVTEETSRTPRTTTEKYPYYPSNVTSGSHLTYFTEETSRTPNTTLKSYPSNVTSEPRSTFTTQDISGTSTSTLEPYPNNATTRLDMSYVTEETSRTPRTTTEKKYPSNITSGSHLIYITEETSRTPNTTLMPYPSNVTTAGDLIYIDEETSRTTNNIQESSSNVTSGSDLTSLTVRTPNSTLQQFQNNVTTDPGLVYLSEKTTGTSNTSLGMDRTSHPDIINPLDPIDIITEAPATWTPNTSVQTGGTFFISAVHCFQDADCPPFTKCTQQGALHICQCHLGYFFHQDLGCVAAITFPARIPISVLLWDEILVNTSLGGNIGDEIRHMEAAQYYQGVHRVRILFQDVLGHIPGYVSTSITDVQSDEGHVTIAHSFSTLYPVTEEDVWRALTVSPLFCADPHDGCVSALTSDNYQGLSLCDFDVCDFSSSDCRFHGGLVTCECRRGYYKFSPMDRSCRECGSGYRTTESGCERCPIGFGGFNCDESYLLAVIVESCVGCGLLVSLITLLVFYFRRKKPQKPMFIDSIVMGVPTNQPSIRLPRAQFSWRREWEWNEPPEKVLTDIHQEVASPDGPAIHMKTFGDPARFSAPSSHHGRHNLSFISD
ncbi:uncharacterized protein [Phyllobates terribilis]|uniref:uncharacterized protein isoform X1 n=1 Tax=Phyllobates terribilis TaxID=111132 RepID=UPI003CCB448A